METATLAADVVALAGLGRNTRILLIKRGLDPFAGRWALPGGAVEANEPTHLAAARELVEETGLVAPQPLQLVGVYGEPGRDPRGRVVSFAYAALFDQVVPVVASDDAAEAVWMRVLDIPQLAFDHDVIVRAALWLFVDGLPELCNAATTASLEGVVPAAPSGVVTEDHAPCACGYPLRMYRSGSYHAPSCPVHEQYLVGLGAVTPR